jgi:hypothetical protein
MLLNCQPWNSLDCPNGFSTYWIKLKVFYVTHYARIDCGTEIHSQHWRGSFDGVAAHDSLNTPVDTFVEQYSWLSALLVETTLRGSSLEMPYHLVISANRIRGQWFSFSKAGVCHLPYIIESNLRPFYSFRGLKNQMRIIFAVESWILEKWYSCCTCHENNTIQ